MGKRAFITGITGQDGSYLAELLLEKGYEVIGMVRRSSMPNLGRISPIMDRITLVNGDLLDQVSLLHLLQEYKPDEVYNLAAQSFVPTSWDQPVLTAELRRWASLACSMPCGWRFPTGGGAQQRAIGDDTRDIAGTHALWILSDSDVGTALLEQRCQNVADCDGLCCTNVVHSARFALRESQMICAHHVANVAKVSLGTQVPDTQNGCLLAPLDRRNLRRKVGDDKPGLLAGPRVIKGAYADNRQSMAQMIL